MRTLSRDVLVESFEEAGVTEYEIHDEYSGRSMFGDRCFSVVVESVTQMFKIFAVLAVKMLPVNDDDSHYLDVPEDVFDLARAARIDSLSTGTIVYFPDWELV